jgi:hypothetical protein
MNELQIRISADIAALQSALKKAENALKLFGEESEESTDKFGKGLKDDIGLLQKLENEAKGLRVLLKGALNEDDVERYNKELEKTSLEMARLNALGRTLGNASTGAAGGINKLATAQGNANGVAIEFNRIIQDAPFGLIGIGNNLQQLAGNFANVSAQAKAAGGNVGTALKASLASIVSPVNLALLGVSALTAGFTAYQMGAFDFITSTEEATTAQEEFNESLKDTELTLKEGFFNELLKAQGLLKTENLGGRLVDVPAFQTASEVLEKLSGTIDGLNKNELEALESFLSQRIADAARAASNATTDLERSLANTDVTGYQEVLTKVNEQLKFYENETVKSTKATEDLQQAINTFSTDPLVDAYFEAVRQGVEFQKRLESAASGLTGNEGENPMKDVQDQTSQSLLSSGSPVKEFADELNQEAQKIVDTNQIIVDSFGALGTQVANSLGIANNGLRGFISLVLSSAPKIISAIIQQANASKVANAKIVAGNAQVAGSEAIASGAKAANALGPVGLALLPVFIGGALALIAGAFSKIGGSKGGISGGGGGGGIPGGGGVPKTFSNAGANVPGSFNPDLAGFGSGFNAGGGKLTAEISGDSLIFVLERAQEKKNRS